MERIVFNKVAPCIYRLRFLLAVVFILAFSLSWAYVPSKIAAEQDEVTSLPFLPPCLCSTCNLRLTV